MPKASPPSAGYGTLDLARARLLATFGYPDFRPPQIRAVQAVLSGRDSLVVLPTGGGKSLCYQVPALIRQGLTVVISPLISLMKDQVDALQRKGVSAEFINSTLSVGDVADRLARARDGSVRMLYLAPERLEAGRALQQLVDVGVSLLAVDEAHCISEWGHDFRPSYRRIGSIRERLGSPQTVALTATATPDVRLESVRQLALRNAEVVVAGFDRINLTYHVRPARSQADKDSSAIALLRATEAPAIVYAPTRNAVERVTAVLVHARIHAAAYHAGLDDARRQRAQDAFMAQRARVIVATSAFGMGIDKPDVRLVVHHSMPGTLEAYYQEAGRAGRDGKPSTCVLLHAYPDRFTHEFFIDCAHPDRATVQQTWTFLRTHADRDGVIARSADEVAQSLASKLGDRKVSAALRVLVAAGACRVEAGAMGRVSVRLLATPERIAGELTGRRALDREVLRAFWRVAGRSLEDGALIDLERLPRRLGGMMGLIPVLKRLEAQQFVTWTPQGAGVRLDPRARDLRSPAVDWYGIDRRRATDLRRLDAMQRYAQTRSCRRAYILRYFGDPEVRSQCAACDRCLGTTEVLPPASTKQSVPGRTRPL